MEQPRTAHNSTLIYIERDDAYLMLHRVSKDNDPNRDKWIGVGGKFEPDESPEECALRETFEETGLRLTSWQYRGILTFVSDRWDTEYIHLFTADGFTGEIHDCDEGELTWVKKDALDTLTLWEGDMLFLRLLCTDSPFFSMKLQYRGEELVDVRLNGRPWEGGR